MQLPKPLSGVARVRGHAIASDAARAAARPIAHQRHAAAQHEDDEGVQPKAVASIKASRDLTYTSTLHFT